MSSYGRADHQWKNPAHNGLDDVVEESMSEISYEQHAPQHPIPTMQGAFEESMKETLEDTEESTLAKKDAAYRRKVLLERPNYTRMVAGKWTQRKGEKFHPLWKITAQLSFGMHLLHQELAKSDDEVIKILQGHVDEVDGFLERTTEDFELAQHDINERIKYLALPLDHGEVFDQMLMDRNFRTSMVEGNVKIEHIVERTSVALTDSLKDVRKGSDGSKELARYLRKLEKTWHGRDEAITEVFQAMMGNTEGWAFAYKELQEKGAVLAKSLEHLRAIIAEIQRLVGIASRRDVPQAYSPSDGRETSRRMSPDRPRTPEQDAQLNIGSGGSTENEAITEPDAIHDAQRRGARTPPALHPNAIIEEDEYEDSPPRNHAGPARGNAFAEEENYAASRNLHLPVFSNTIMEEDEEDEEIEHVPSHGHNRVPPLPAINTIAEEEEEDEDLYGSSPPPNQQMHPPISEEAKGLGDKHKEHGGVAIGAAAGVVTGLGIMTASSHLTDHHDHPGALTPEPFAERSHSPRPETIDEEDEDSDDSDYTIDIVTATPITATAVHQDFRSHPTKVVQTRRQNSNGSDRALDATTPMFSPENIVNESIKEFVLPPLDLESETPLPTMTPLHYETMRKDHTSPSFDLKVPEEYANQSGGSEESRKSLPHPFQRKENASETNAVAQSNSSHTTHPKKIPLPEIIDNSPYQSPEAYDEQQSPQTDYTRGPWSPESNLDHFEYQHEPMPTSDILAAHTIMQQASQSHKDIESAQPLYSHKVSQRNVEVALSHDQTEECAPPAGVYGLPANPREYLDVQDPNSLADPAIDATAPISYPPHVGEPRIAGSANSAANSNRAIQPQDDEDYWDEDATPEDEDDEQLPLQGQFAPIILPMGAIRVADADIPKHEDSLPQTSTTEDEMPQMSKQPRQLPINDLLLRLRYGNGLKTPTDPDPVVQHPLPDSYPVSPSQYDPTTPGQDSIAAILTPEQDKRFHPGGLISDPGRNPPPPQGSRPGPEIEQQDEHVADEHRKAFIVPVLPSIVQSGPNGGLSSNEPSQQALHGTDAVNRGLEPQASQHQNPSMLTKQEQFDRLVQQRPIIVEPPLLRRRASYSDNRLTLKLAELQQHQEAQLSPNNDLLSPERIVFSPKYYPHSAMVPTSGPWTFFSKDDMDHSYRRRRAHSLYSPATPYDLEWLLRKTPSDMAVSPMRWSEIYGFRSGVNSIISPLGEPAGTRSAPFSPQKQDLSIDTVLKPRSNSSAKLDASSQQFRPNSLLLDLAKARGQLSQAADVKPILPTHKEPTLREQRADRSAVRASSIYSKAPDFSNMSFSPPPEVPQIIRTETGYTSAYDVDEESQPSSSYTDMTFGQIPPTPAISSAKPSPLHFAPKEHIPSEPTSPSSPMEEPKYIAEIPDEKLTVIDIPPESPDLASLTSATVTGPEPDFPYFSATYGGPEPDYYSSQSMEDPAEGVQKHPQVEPREQTQIDSTLLRPDARGNSPQPPYERSETPNSIGAYSTAPSQSSMKRREGPPAALKLFPSPDLQSRVTSPRSQGFPGPMQPMPNANISNQHLLALPPLQEPLPQSAPIQPTKSKRSPLKNLFKGALSPNIFHKNKKGHQRNSSSGSNSLARGATVANAQLMGGPAPGPYTNGSIDATSTRNGSFGDITDQRRPSGERILYGMPGSDGRPF